MWKTSYAAEHGGVLGANFDAAWAQIAAEDASAFLKAQHDYVKAVYFDRAVSQLEAEYGFDITSRSFALQNVLWSTAVHHGVSGAISIFGKADLGSSDEDIINRVYDERQRTVEYEEALEIKGASESNVHVMTGPKAESLGIGGLVMRHFYACSSSIQIGVYKRFTRERADVIEMLRQETSAPR
jgi:hypothetical protein